MIDRAGGPAGDVRLLGAADVRELADRVGLQPNKQRGQNFVVDPNTIRRIVRSAQLEPAEHVLEIGSGLGSLTLGLLAAGYPVMAVEVDPVLAAALPDTVEQFAPGHASDLTVITADALTLTPPAQPTEPTALVANLPYNVAVPILLHLLEVAPALTRVLVMVQAEVAERLAARPGSRVYGVPSVKASWYGEVSRVATISRTVFWPMPNVDSALVRLVRTEPPATAATRAQVFAVVDAAFAQRRKTLRGALATWAGSAGRAEAILRAAGIEPRSRGESLTIADFARLAEHRLRPPIRSDT